MSAQTKNQYAMQDPTKQYPQPKFKDQSQSAPGLARDMDPKPDHASWLQSLMTGNGVDSPEVMNPFRARVLGAIRTITTDSIVVSHFLAINAVVAAATNDDRVVCFRPAHCSRTVVEIADGRVTLVELGDEGNGAARV